MFCLITDTVAAVLPSFDDIDEILNSSGIMNTSSSGMNTSGVLTDAVMADTTSTTAAPVSGMCVILCLRQCSGWRHYVSGVFVHSWMSLNRHVHHDILGIC